MNRQRPPRLVRMLGADSVLGLIGLILFGVLVNALFQLATDFSWVAVAVAVGTTLGLLLLVPLNQLLNQRSRPPQLGLAAEREFVPTAGLIVIVSIPGKGPDGQELPLNTTAAGAAIVFHSQIHAAGQPPLLRRCWLIHSAKTQPYAEALQQQYATDFPCVPVPVTDIESAKATFEAVNRCYGDGLLNGLRAGDITADCTGGTKAMTVGMALAAAAQQSRSLEYIPTAYDERGNPDRQKQLDPLLVSIEFFLGDEQQ